MRKCIFFITLILMSALTATVYAGEVPARYSFEGYTGGIPIGWEGNTANCMEKVIVDEDHGTSLALHNIGPNTKPELRYAVPEVSSGRFLLSFEINARDVNKNLRITLESPSSGSMWHSIFYMNTSREMCAWMNNSAGAWDPQKMLSFELDKWYKVDILIDMDNKSVKYYVDGVYYTSSAVSFDDFSRIFFRTENGVDETEGYTYLDNVSFKYLTADGMELFLESETPGAEDDTVSISFSELIAVSTLNKLEAYSMGNNPIEYVKTPLGCEIVSQSNSGVTVKFNENFKENTIYKIEIPGLTSIFGDEYVNNSVYFATNRAKTDKKVVNADFSTAEVGAEVSPKTDVKWTTSSPYVRIALVNDLDAEGEEIPTVRFSRRNSEMSLKRDLETAFDDRVVLEYKIKAETPMQIFRVYDSLGAYTDLVTVNSDGIYFGENKLSDCLEGWFTVSIELNQPEHKAVFSLNGEEKGEYEYDAITDVKAVEFVQKNIEGAMGDDRAKTDLAYFTASASALSVGADLVMFEGADGKTYYPDDNITAKLSKIIVKFSDSVKPDSLDGGVSLTLNGNEESFEGEYDAKNQQYIMKLPQYLWGNSSYAIEINGVLDGAGATTDPAFGIFNTEPGVYECDEMNIELFGQNVNINTEITHTNACYDDVYLVYAAYSGDFMVDFKAEKIVPNENERKISVSKTYTAPSDSDNVRAFLWDGFDTRRPISAVKSVLCE
ncbi:MAG: Ig-like domain-containing protein [Clostridia bacterium]|nr:Ig-like domain-containing protein [Clostridia bacterium]